MFVGPALNSLCLAIVTFMTGMRHRVLASCRMWHTLHTSHTSHTLPPHPCQTATEKRILLKKEREALYREYQRTTSPLLPWPKYGGGMRIKQD